MREKSSYDFPQALQYMLDVILNYLVISYVAQASETLT